MLGFAAYQAAAAGSYSPSDYAMNFIVINTFAILLIIIGVAVGYKVYKKACNFSTTIPLTGAIIAQYIAGIGPFIEQY